MNRREFLQLAAASALSITSTRAHAATSAHPNIVFIMTDDQGPWAWGQGGHPNARTPNLDKLASQGARLDQYFVTSAVCSPCRASILASRYPSETGVMDYLPKTADPNLGLSPALPVWPQLLQKAGYHTAMFGKWHVGEHDRFLPSHFGYDEFKGWRHGAMVSKDPVVEIDGNQVPMTGYTSDILGDLAVDFISAKRDQPFLLSLHFWAPHANQNTTPDGDRTWMPLSDADWDQFKDIKPTLPEPNYPKLDIPRADRMTREYLASVASVDRNVGRVLDTLDERGIAENTVVIFTSDHGFNMGHHGIWHKGNGRWLLVGEQGDRPNLWDTTLRAPAIIRAPKQIAPGTVVNHVINNLDWFPTILALAGLEVPADIKIRGRNFLPPIQGAKIKWNNDLFVQYQQMKGRESDADLRAYRTPEWKLIRDFNRKDADEFYDLTDDPNETKNLITSTDPKVDGARIVLSQKLRAVMLELRDPSIIAER
jgi:choline-sulfatase